MNAATWCCTRVQLNEEAAIPDSNGVIHGCYQVSSGTLHVIGTNPTVGGGKCSSNEKSLDWKNLGPVVAQYRSLIEKEVEADTRKLDSFEDFKKFTADTPPAAEPGGRRGPAGMSGMSLRAFADQRRKYLLDYKEPKAGGGSGPARGPGG